MKPKLGISLLSTILISWSTFSCAGILNPDCTAKKAVESAAMKAAIGVGGRCSAAEAAKDTLGIKDKKHKKKNKKKDKKKKAKD